MAIPLAHLLQRELMKTYDSACSADSSQPINLYEECGSMFSYENRRHRSNRPSQRFREFAFLSSIFLASKQP
mgnify:CR=1 FL=1